MNDIKYQTKKHEFFRVFALQKILTNKKVLWPIPNCYSSFLRCNWAATEGYCISADSVAEKYKLVSTVEKSASQFIKISSESTTRFQAKKVWVCTLAVFNIILGEMYFSFSRNLTVWLIREPTLLENHANVKKKILVTFILVDISETRWILVYQIKMWIQRRLLHLVPLWVKLVREKEYIYKNSVITKDSFYCKLGCSYHY